MWEAYQKALATAAALEEEIEQLSCPCTRSQPEVRAQSRSRDCWIHGSRGGREGTTRCGQRTAQPPTLNITPPEGTWRPAARQWLLKTLTWRNCRNWGQRLPASSEGQLRNQRKKKRHPLPNPQWKSSMSGWLGKLKLVKHLAGGESCWQYQRCKTAQSWHRRCSLISSPQKGKWAKQDGELPSGPTCTTVSPQKEFPATSRFYLCLLGHWEMQREKTVAYNQVLQYWVEKADLPTGGKPCLLAESMMELQEEMGCYLSFSNEETSTGPAKKAKPLSVATTPASAPEVQATTKAAREPAAERRSPKFPGWEKVLHPSQPVVAAGQIPHLSRSLG